MRLREVQLRWLAEVAGGSEDIDALAFDVLMEAANSAREDVKALMSEIRAARS